MPNQLNGFAGSNPMVGSIFSDIVEILTYSQRKPPAVVRLPLQHLTIQLLLIPTNSPADFVESNSAIGSLLRVN